MDFRQTVLLYLLIGGGVAIGFAARSSDKGRAWATILAAWVFWPLFVPLLLAVDDEVPTTPTGPTPEPFDQRMARSCELLDHLAATGPALGIVDLPEQVAQIKTFWAERSNWLAETGQLIQSLNANHSPATIGLMPPTSPQVEELLRRKQATEESLTRSLSGIEELAVHIQLLKAPGVDRTAELARIERVLRAILELEAGAPSPSLR